MPFKCSTLGCGSSANGETPNPGGISSSRLLATSRRTLQQSAAGCKQPTSQLGYQEATSFMRTSRRRVHDATLRRRPGRRFSYNGKLQNFLPTPNNPPISRSGEAFALTEILIDLTILSGQSAR